MASCAEEINANITCNNFSKSISKSLVLEMSLNPNFSRISLFNSKSFVGFLNSFENVFLIMTSNVGSYNSHKIGIGFGNSETSPSDKDFEDSFLPEFRNRIDSVITFNTLPESVMKKICKKFLNELKDMLRNKKIDFKYNDDIINYIVSKVGSSENGARPMKHIITNEIKNKIAKNLVFGKYKENSIINLTMNENTES